MHIDMTFNWRATMGNAANIPADVADYLDLVTGLAQDDGFYQGFTASHHSCAADDPIVILDHVRRQGLCQTIADYRLYDKAVAAVRSNRKVFFDDAEIERRMKQADGSCPMCGFVTAFHSGVDPQGFSTMMTHCQHNLGHRVKPEDVEAYLRRPSSWQGHTWPYAYMVGRKIVCTDGADVEGLMPCAGCLEMEAAERMEAAFTALITMDNPERFAKPGWGSPLSEYGCVKRQDDCTACGADICNATYARVKRALSDKTGWSNSKELRLNGAGLKLYVRLPHTGMSLRQTIFSMRVGGDQEKDYPGFREHAHALFEGMGVPTTMTA